MITRKQLKRVTSIYGYLAGTSWGRKFIDEFFKHLWNRSIGKLKKKDVDRWLNSWEERK